MSKPIQSMFEKRRSRFTNTRSERAMERGLATPEPAATSGSESCRGSGGTVGGRMGAEGLVAGGTGKAVNPMAQRGPKLCCPPAHLSTLPLAPSAEPRAPRLLATEATAHTVPARDSIETQVRALFLPPARKGSVFEEPGRVQIDEGKTALPRCETGRYGHRQLGFDHSPNHQAETRGARD